jgi:L-asparagine transporter-like permease
VLAEMAIFHPAADSLEVYGDVYVGAWAGFATRLTYWFAETVADWSPSSRRLACASAFWFPDVPSILGLGFVHRT